MKVAAPIPDPRPPLSTSMSPNQPHRSVRATGTKGGDVAVIGNLEPPEHRVTTEDWRELAACRLPHHRCSSPRQRTRPRPRRPRSTRPALSRTHPVPRPRPRGRGTYGIWGGMTEKDRRRHTRRLRGAENQSLPPPLSRPVAAPHTNTATTVFGPHHKLRFPFGRRELRPRGGAVAGEQRIHRPQHPAPRFG